MKREAFHQLNQPTGLGVEQPRALPGKESPFANVVWGFLLACLGSGCAVLSFVTAFGLPVSVWLPLCAVLLFPAFFTAMFSVRYAIVPGFLVAVAAWLFSLWRGWEAAALGLLKTSSLMIEQFESHSQWSFVDLGADIANMAGAPAEQRVTLFLLLALFPWVGLLTWAVVKRHSFFLSFVLTVPLVAVPLWFYIQPVFPLLMGVLLFWAAMAFARMVPRSDRGAAGWVALYSIPALALCLVLLTALIPMKGYERPARMEDLRLRAESWVRSLPGLMAAGDGDLPTLPGKNFLSYDQDRRSFDGLDSARFTGQTALRVKVEGGGGGALYLKGFTGGVYTAGGWERLDGEAEAVLEAACAPLHPQNLTAYRYADENEERTVTVLNQANKKAVYAPNWLVTTPQIFALGEFEGDGAIRAKGLLGLDQYSLTYIAQTANLERVRGVDDLPPGTEELDRYGEAVYQYYTLVPEELGPVLDDVLVRANLNPGTAQYAAREVSALLAQTASYTLTPGAPPEGRDFTEYFLTENHKGFCVHFATAGVLLMRRLGIPARYCEGFLVTPTDLRLRGSDGYSNVPDRRAHAWVEYWRDGVGWMTMECTPGFNPQADLVQPNDGSNEAEATPEPTKTPAVTAAPTPAPTPAPEATQQPREIDLAEERAAALLKAAVWPLLAALLALAVLVRRRIVLGLRRRDFACADGNRAALAVYAASARLTPYAGEMDPRMTELAEKARFSQHMLEPDELRALKDDWTTRQKKALAESNALVRAWLVVGLCLEPGRDQKD